MGKDLRGKELGRGISQREDGLYVARYTNKYGKRVQKVLPKLQELRQWLVDAQYKEEHSNIDFPDAMTVNAWFEYWIGIKKRTVRPNTVRNYTERYHRNIEPIIGNKMLGSVNTIHCQTIMNRMADEGYRTSTIYQTRIALFNMLDYAYQNDVILKNPCNKMVKSEIGKQSRKKQALTLGQQKEFCKVAIGNTYEYQYRFLLQTGLRTGEMVGLRWSDVDLENRLLTINRSMEYRHSTGEWRIGEPKSKSGYRTIPLTEEAVEILKLQKQKNRTFIVIPMEWADIVFLCKKGTPVKNSTYDTMLFKLCDKTGIDRFSMHVLRHTFATRCIEAGMKPKTLQTILGHSNIGITMNLYVHTTEEQKHKEIDLVADALKVI